VGAGTSAVDGALNTRVELREKGGCRMDISVIVRWIVVFLVIFILLMFFVFSLFRKSAAH
jgi:hypothetical protein